jgi:hypothetical protein
VRRIAVAVGLLAIVGLIGVLVTRVGDAEPAPPSAASVPPAGPEPTVSPAPSAVLMPSVDVDGARVRAIEVVASTGEVVRAGLISRRELIESFTTDRFGELLASDTSAQVNAMLAELGARGIDASQLQVVEQPITATATTVGTGVRVVVWSVLVVTAPGTGVARQVWRTVTVDLVDVDDVWLVDGWASTPGPTPALAPDAIVSPPAEVAAMLSAAPVVGVG